MSESKIKRVSFSLEPEYQQLLRQIAQRTRRTMTEEMRLMIDARALQLGLRPVQSPAADDSIDAD